MRRAHGGEVLKAVRGVVEWRFWQDEMRQAFSLRCKIRGIEPRALPWAGMRQAFGLWEAIPNQPPSVLFEVLIRSLWAHDRFLVPDGCCRINAAFRSLQERCIYAAAKNFVMHPSL